MEPGSEVIPEIRTCTAPDSSGAVLPGSPPALATEVSHACVQAGRPAVYHESPENLVLL
jgi:hypothetical protein